jgi:hypothetical protein
MESIHIARAGRSLGRYTAEDVAEGLASGKFLPTDLAWRDPMPSWVPLSAFQGLPHVAPVVAEPPALPPPEPAWERRAALGATAAAVQTVTGVLGEARRIFPSMAHTGGLSGPLLFNLLVGTVSGWVALAYHYMIVHVNPEALGEGLRALPLGMVNWMFAGMVLFTPVGVVIGAFVASGLYHGLLVMLSKTPVRFESTFRIYCYAWGAASVMQVVPGCGALLFPVAGVYLMVLGLRLAQGVSALAAALVVGLPVLVCYGGLLALQVAVGLAG